MALYEYHCPACGARTEKRMPMSDVLQFVPCSSCGKQAQKILGSFALLGRAEAAVGDGPPPWESDADADNDFGDMGDDAGHSHDFGHEHSHGPGGHTH